MKKMILLGLIVLLGGVVVATYAQVNPKVEVAGMFTYDRFHPASQYAPSTNLWGGCVAVTVNLNKYFGIKNEWIGYGSSTSTYTLIDPLVTTKGTIPAGVYQVSGNLFTYLFGPVVKYRTPKAQPFGEILFGAANTNVYANLYNAAGVTGAAPDSTGFALAVGGGLDIPVSK